MFNCYILSFFFQTEAFPHFINQITEIQQFEKCSETEETVRPSQLTFLSQIGPEHLAQSEANH